MWRSSSRLAPFAAALLCGALLAASPPSQAAERRAEARLGDRDRARLACRDAARRQDWAVRGTSPARELDDRRLRIRMNLTRGNRRWIATCTYDIRSRRAELDARRVETGRSGRPAGSPSAQRVRDACIRAVTQNARTQLVAAGRVERRSSGASVMPMTINVEGNERRVRCFYDNATGAVTVR